MRATKSAWSRCLVVGHLYRMVPLVLVILFELPFVQSFFVGSRTVVLAAPPCLELTSPAAPSPNGLPGMPNTGGGGGDGTFCRDNPSDPDCAGTVRTLPDSVIPRVHRSEAATVPVTLLGDTGMPVVASRRLLAPPPCDDTIPDPPSGAGQVATPTPVPLIPVDVPREASALASSVEVPQVQVHMNPTIGMVNVPTWFWAEGYRGQDLVASRSWSPPYEPTTIEVRYHVKKFVWNYGDGGQIENLSLGQAYPQVSDIRNTYQWSSRSEPGGVFHVALIVQWDVAYRVNGSTPETLPSVQRRYETSYPVQQLQPIITNP